MWRLLNFNVIRTTQRLSPYTNVAYYVIREISLDDVCSQIGYIVIFFYKPYIHVTDHSNCTQLNAEETALKATFLIKS